MSLAAQTQSLQAEDQLLGTEGVQGRTEVAQDFNAHSDSISDGAKSLPELQPVVTLGWLDELGEPGSVLAPVKLSTVDHDTGNGGTMATDPLRSTVHDNVGTVINWADKVAACTKGVINLEVRFVSFASWHTRSKQTTYHNRNTLLVCSLGNGLKVRNIIAGVTNRLNVDSLGTVINGRSNILRLITLDKLGSNSQAREHNLELVVGATVQVAGGDDVVSGMGEGRDGHELGCLARGGSNGSNTTFQSCNALLEDVDCRVHDSAVDVAELLEAEEPRAVGRIIEHIRASRVNWDST